MPPETRRCAYCRRTSSHRHSALDGRATGIAFERDRRDSDDTALGDELYRRFLLRKSDELRRRRSLKGNDASLPYPVGMGKPLVKPDQPGLRRIA